MSMRFVSYPIVIAAAIFSTGCEPAKINPITSTVIIRSDAPIDREKLFRILEQHAKSEGFTIENASQSRSRTTLGKNTIYLALYSWRGNLNSLEVLADDTLEMGVPRVTFYDGWNHDVSSNSRIHLTETLISNWDHSQVYGPNLNGTIGGPTETSGWRPTERRASFSSHSTPNANR